VLHGENTVYELTSSEPASHFRVHLYTSPRPPEAVAYIVSLVIVLVLMQRWLQSDMLSVLAKDKEVAYESSVSKVGEPPSDM
jgi:hypothetical protein